MKRELVDFLVEFITPERSDLYDKILKDRTRYLTVVFEDIYQPQNASAVLRSADCFGVQDVYVIENKNRFEVDTEVAMGSSKWIDIHRFNKKEQNTLDAITHLKEKGYRIVATSPHIQDTNLEDFDLSKGKTAFVFGTEKLGISDVVKSEADEFMKIPMYGFTESFNISVTVALTLHLLTHKLRQENTIDWHLTEDEMVDVKLEWIRRTLKSVRLIEEVFYRDHPEARGNC